MTKEVVIFAINGFIGLFIAYTMYGLFLDNFQFEINKSYFIAYLISVTYSFIANKILTFNNAENISPIMIVKFTILTLLAMKLSSLLNLFIHDQLLHLDLGNFIAFSSGIALAAVINFFGMKIFIFNKLTQ